MDEREEVEPWLCLLPTSCRENIGQSAPPALPRSLTPDLVGPVGPFRAWGAGLTLLNGCRHNLLHYEAKTYKTLQRASQIIEASLWPNEGNTRQTQLFGMHFQRKLCIQQVIFKLDNWLWQMAFMMKRTMFCSKDNPQKRCPGGGILRHKEVKYSVTEYTSKEDFCIASWAWVQCGIQVVTQKEMKLTYVKRLRAKYVDYATIMGGAWYHLQLFEGYKNQWWREAGNNIMDNCMILRKRKFRSLGKSSWCCISLWNTLTWEEI